MNSTRGHQLVMNEYVAVFAASLTPDPRHGDP
jgi:hypothetical protein